MQLGLSLSHLGDHPTGTMIHLKTGQGDRRNNYLLKETVCLYLQGVPPLAIACESSLLSIPFAECDHWTAFWLCLVLLMWEPTLIFFLDSVPIHLFWNASTAEFHFPFPATFGRRHSKHKLGSALFLWQTLVLWCAGLLPTHFQGTPLLLRSSFTSMSSMELTLLSP